MSSPRVISGSSFQCLRLTVLVRLLNDWELRPTHPGGNISTMAANGSCPDGETLLLWSLVLVVEQESLDPQPHLVNVRESLDSTLLPLGADATIVSSVKKLAVLGCVR